MRISTVYNKENVSFKSSQVNFVSMADNHGDLLAMPQMFKAIQINKKDIFEKAADNSTLNVLAIAGDFFMNPAKKGFLTNPDFNNGDVQYNFLIKCYSLQKRQQDVKATL